MFSAAVSREITRARLVVVGFIRFRVGSLGHAVRFIGVRVVGTHRGRP